MLAQSDPIKRRALYVRLIVLNLHFQHLYKKPFVFLMLSCNKKKCHFDNNDE